MKSQKFMPSIPGRLGKAWFELQRGGLSAPQWDPQLFGARELKNPNNFEIMRMCILIAWRGEGLKALITTNLYNLSL